VEKALAGMLGNYDDSVFLCSQWLSVKSVAKKTWLGGWAIKIESLSVIICGKRKIWLWGWDYLIFVFSAFSATSAVREVVFVIARSPSTGSGNDN
jgi:hypothetical protein